MDYNMEDIIKERSYFVTCSSLESIELYFDLEKEKEFLVVSCFQKDIHKNRYKLYLHKFNLIEKEVILYQFALHLNHNNNYQFFDIFKVFKRLIDDLGFIQDKIEKEKKEKKEDYFKDRHLPGRGLRPGFPAEVP